MMMIVVKLIMGIIVMMVVDIKLHLRCYSDLDHL